VNEDQFQKNADIIRKQWINELESTMEEVEQLIRDDFYTGIWGFLLNKIVAIVYGFLLSNDIKEKILRQSEILIAASKEFNGKPDEIVQKFFEPYLKEDPSFERAKKKHLKLSELKERYKRSFILLVGETARLLRSEGDNYDEIFVNAYKTKEEASKATFSILDHAKEDLEFAIEHNMIKLNILVRDQIIRILRKEIEIGRKYYEIKINEAFQS